ncbi:endocuticle structural glycoprotein SgAbd-2-like isoform X2 [Daktulosphaira vitifoliae]|uniref:endocuticle structural glycoprotein SgAbd-2-like isoform X2 n=1 Tax=Daktulosphaira vitifoliae TaxID=58002 RepID=UPI0021A9D5FC|nr:endocuticle structural glycoprotein SgAbd-2-like isoform X2 [Daktulosphaira vitifoliae]
MKFFVILTTVIAAVFAAGENKPVAFNGLNPWNLGYTGYPGHHGYYPGHAGHPGYTGYPGYRSYYPGYSGYPGYQGFYSGYPGYNRGYYPGPTPVAPVTGRQPAILSQSQEANLDGSFRYGFQTENGIVNQAQGYVKNAGTEAESQVIEGSYAYTSNDGTPVEVKYYADDTGFHASGNVVPSNPAEISKSLEFNVVNPQTNKKK